MTSKFTRTGFILYVEDYSACTKFYRETLGLEVMFTTDMLTCFAFGGSYLMVEKDDPRSSQGSHLEHRTCLRMNVRNVKAFAERLMELGVKVDYQEHTWGTVAKFEDPDGNLCAFKDDEKFEKQVLGDS